MLIAEDLLRQEWEGKRKGREGEREVQLLPDKYNAINKRLPLQGKNLATSKIGFFPSDAVRPCPCVSVHVYCDQ